jgi:hypothetical protein
MVMANDYKNGDKTYSKTSFSGSKHPRGQGGSFKKNPNGTEEERVSYHHKFSSKGHPRGKDGTFNSSEGCKLGYEKYGPKR